MKIYKLLLLVLLGSFAFSCSQETFEEQTIVEPNGRLASGQFDNSHLGLYKGLFTTADGLTRGSVAITLSPTNEGVAQITLSTGEVIELKSPAVKLTVDNKVNNLRFSSLGLSPINVSLDFSVEANGANPVVSNVTFDTKESDILIAKNISRLPATPITGTYDCTNCAAAGVGFPNGRTWNVMSIGMGNNQSYAVQISYGGQIYNSTTGTQNDCIDAAGYSICDIEGMALILGYGISWNGTHEYDTSTTEACSSVSGFWSAPTYGPGITGTFVSDADCTTSTPENDTCANALPIACGASITGTTLNATIADPLEYCGAESNTVLNTAPGVWYSFTSSISQGVTIDTNGSEFDTQLGVFSGSCGDLVCVDGNDDVGEDTNSYIRFIAGLGMTYYVYVTGWGSESGTYNLNITCDAPEDLTCDEFLVDNGGTTANYSDNSYDIYLIDAGEGNTVSLQFSEFNLEQDWDFLQVYDGDNSATEITMSVGGNTTLDLGGEYHGFTGTGSNSLNNDSVVSSGQFLTVVFFSDEGVNAPGFNAEVVCISGRTAQGNQKTTAVYKPVKDLSSRTKMGELNKSRTRGRK